MCAQENLLENKLDGATSPLLLFFDVLLMSKIYIRVFLNFRLMANCYLKSYKIDV